MLSPMDAFLRRERTHGGLTVSLPESGQTASPFALIIRQSVCLFVRELPNLLIGNRISYDWKGCGQGEREFRVKCFLQEDRYAETREYGFLGLVQDAQEVPPLERGTEHVLCSVAVLVAGRAQAEFVSILKGFSVQPATA